MKSMSQTLNFFWDQFFADFFRQKVKIFARFARK